jgi:hypothetical protein
VNARDFGEKVDNIARDIHAQEAVIAIAGIEAERYARRQAAAENAVARLKGLLKFFMDSRQIRSMKGLLNTISLRKRPGLAPVCGSNEAAGRVLASFPQHEHSRVERRCSVSA